MPLADCDARPRRQRPVKPNETLTLAAAVGRLGSALSHVQGAADGPSVALRSGRRGDVTDAAGPTDTLDRRRRVRNPAQAAKGRTNVLPFVFLGTFPCAPQKAACRGRRRGLSRRNVRCIPVIQRSEPMFNVPPAVVATVVVLLLVHALRMLVLTDAEDLRFLLTFAFIPARYDIDLVNGGSFPGGFRRRPVDVFHLRLSACRSPPYRSQSGMAAAVWHRARAPVRSHGDTWRSCSWSPPPAHLPIWSRIAERWCR